MSCEWEDDVMEYLEGGLAEDRREAFEDHYLACPVCFGLLRAADAGRAALGQGERSAAAPFEARRARGLPLWGGLAAAACVTLAIWITRGPEAPPPLGPTPLPVAAAPVVSPSLASSAARRAALSRLTDVDPPRYLPLRTRGAGANDVLEHGMERYVAGDYRRAVPLLRRASEGGAATGQVLLFLGVSELLSGDTAAAVRTLSRGRDLGGALSEETTLMLAKAQFRTGDVGAARRTLESLAASPRAAEAQALLDALRTLEPSGR